MRGRVGGGVGLKSDTGVRVVSDFGRTPARGSAA